MSTASSGDITSQMPSLHNKSARSWDVSLRSVTSGTSVTPQTACASMSPKLRDMFNPGTMPSSSSLDGNSRRTRPPAVLLDALPFIRQFWLVVASQGLGHQAAAPWGLFQEDGTTVANMGTNEALGIVVVQYDCCCRARHARAEVGPRRQVLLQLLVRCLHLRNQFLARGSAQGQKPLCKGMLDVVRHHVALLPVPVENGIG
eukprot:CAMPEP_0170203996 /NCGR_PEP_ID=MMETSP0116_2-20130129/1513_1 /TAXON_ID=400756 /ORGANISM="Durinskia baltica, Strain CSIRO CS-38" /LENGTH=201 /DNA_ID=CAMNT_0010454329 /DNA_START=533 /DNA_END=1139 /DNA_ORIENTATION=+